MARNFRSRKGTFSKAPHKDSELGEQTAQQTDQRDPRFMGLYADNYLLMANGGTWDNPMGYPGYNMMYVGSPMNYRWMLQHPTLRLVRSIAVSDILASKWEYRRAKKNATEEQRQFISEIFDPLRTDLMCDFFVRGRDFGWYPGEPIWEIEKRRTILARVKPLLPEYTEAMQDKSGNFTGLRNSANMTDSGDAVVTIPAPYKAWKFTYDSEGGYHYGRSWLENVRMTAWRSWLDTSQQLQRLGAKITGTQIIVTTPTGTFPSGNNDGKTLSYRDVALNFVKSIATGGPGGWIPGINIPTDPKGKAEVARLIADLIGKSQVHFELLDFGSTTPAIQGLLEKMRHEEENMFAGGLRPVRSGLASEHGGLADAEQHTDTGTKNSELDDRLFAKAVQPLIDAALVLNFGESARGNIVIEPPPLVSNKLGLLRALLLALCNDPAFVQELCTVLDVNDALKFLSLMTLDGKTFDPIRMQKTREAANKKTQNPEPQGGRPAKQSTKKRKAA